MSTYGIAQSVSSWYGALVMALIAGMSIYMVALALVRFFFFRSIRVDTRKLFKQVTDALGNQDAAALAELKGQRLSDPPARIMVSTVLNNQEMDHADMNEMLRIAQTRQRERLTRGLTVFGTFATIGPFMGLFATVLGIIESFHNLAQTGAAGPNVVSSGVAAALWGTAAGLALGIPAVILYNIFNKKAKSAMMEMEVVSRELVLILKNPKHLKGKS